MKFCIKINYFYIIFYLYVFDIYIGIVGRFLVMIEFDIVFL